MRRHQFYTAISVADKFFDTSSAAVADRVLTIDEHQQLVIGAQAEVRKTFPEFASDISLTALRDPREDFAGYRISYEGDPYRVYDNEFDFGSQGIDVA